VGGRARRHEHAAHVAVGQHSRHALACLIGLGPTELTEIAGPAPKIDPKNVALVGIREVDQLERPHVRQSGVCAFTMREIDERGLRAVMEEAIDIAGAGTDGIHLSLDMDVCDPAEAPGVGTPCAAASPTARRTWRWRS